MLSTSKDKENLGETPLIFSNYEGILGLMRSYFDYCWQQATNRQNSNLTLINQPNADSNHILQPNQTTVT